MTGIAGFFLTLIGEPVFLLILGLIGAVVTLLFIGTVGIGGIILVVEVAAIVALVTRSAGHTLGELLWIVLAAGLTLFTLILMPVLVGPGLAIASGLLVREALREMGHPGHATLAGIITGSIVAIYLLLHSLPGLGAGLPISGLGGILGQPQTVTHCVFGPVGCTIEPAPQPCMNPLGIGCPTATPTPIPVIHGCDGPFHLACWSRTATPPPTAVPPTATPAIPGAPPVVCTHQGPWGIWEDCHEVVTPVPPPTATPLPTATWTLTPSPTATRTPVPTRTATPTNTSTPMSTPTLRPTRAPTRPTTPSATPTDVIIYVTATPTR